MSTDEVIVLMKNVIIITSIYWFIYYVIIVISMWKLYKKEEMKPWISLIPIYNLYKLMKMLNFPFILLFIPIINNIIIFFLPYRLARYYRCNKWQRILSILIPWIMIPYIAFSDKEYRYTTKKHSFLRTIDDVNNLETHLEADSEVIIDDYIEPSKKAPIKNNMNKFVENIEANIINDEFVFDEAKIENTEETHSKIVPELGDINADDIIEIKDETIEKIKSIDVLEENVQNAAKVEKIVETNIKEYEGAKVKDEAIAFGGKEKEEKNSEAKIDELKCSRCGSSLVGAKGFCPGCGAQI